MQILLFFYLISCFFNPLSKNTFIIESVIRKQIHIPYIPHTLLNIYARVNFSHTLIKKLNFEIYLNSFIARNILE